MARKRKKTTRSMKDLPVAKLGARKARQVKGGAASSSDVGTEKIGPGRS
ncbi:MAG TPA: hypothetical protein VKJ00_15795 [Thermoanaerobaculia bacterium]|nr:hypothetical protein [Thermoanaerobaculia bacterium]